MLRDHRLLPKNESLYPSLRNLIFRDLLLADYVCQYKIEEELLPVSSESDGSYIYFYVQELHIHMCGTL